MSGISECLSSEIVGIEHDTLIGLRVSPVFQNTHLEKIIQYIDWQAIQNLDSCIALQHGNHKLFLVFPLSFRLF